VRPIPDPNHSSIHVHSAGSLPCGECPRILTGCRRGVSTRHLAHISDVRSWYEASYQGTPSGVPISIQQESGFSRCKRPILLHRLRHGQRTSTNHRLYVNHRRPIDRFDRSDPQTPPLNLPHNHRMQPNRIRPIRRPCREHTRQPALRI